MENITIIIILSIALLASIAFNHILYGKIQSIAEEKENIKKEKEKADNKIEWFNKKKLDELNNIDYIGRKGVYVESLIWQTGEHANKSFSVTYEVEILEFTDTKFKIKANSAMADQSFASDSKYKNSYLSYINDRNNWVNRADVQLMMDDTTKRNLKLEKILGK